MGEFASPAFLLPFAVFVILLFALPGARPFSQTEINSLRAARGGFGSAISAATLPEPPLYDLLLVPFTAVTGKWDGIARALSILIALASFAVWFRVARRFFGTSAWIPAWLIATSAYIVFAARLALPYALAMLLTAVATDLFLALLERPTKRRWIAYGVVLFLSAYTLSLTIITVVAHLAVFAIAWRKNPRRLLPPLTVALVVGVLFFPWLVLSPSGGAEAGGLGLGARWMAGMAHAAYSVYAFAVGDSLSPFAMPLSAAAGVFYALLVVLGLIRIAKGKTTHRHLLVAMMGLGLFCIFGGYAIGVSGPATWFNAAPLLFLAPFFLFILACALVAIKNRRLRYATLGTALVIQCLSLFNYYTGRQWSNWTYVLPAKEIAKYLAENTTSDDMVLLNTEQMGDGIAYHWKGDAAFHSYYASGSELLPELKTANRVWLVRRNLNRHDMPLDLAVFYLDQEFDLVLQASREYVKEPPAIFERKRRWAMRYFKHQVQPYKVEVKLFRRANRQQQ